MTMLDMNLNPPLNDPHESGTKQWDELRAQHMLSLDEIRHARQEIAIKDGRITDLQKDIERLNASLEASRREAVSLQATLRHVANAMVEGVKTADENRRKADPYAPPTEKASGGELPSEEQESIEELVGRLGAADFKK